MRPIFRFLCLCGAAALAGCATEAVLTPSSVPLAGPAADGTPPAAAGPDTGSQGMAAVADNMAATILALPIIADAKATPRVVLQPLANETGVAIDPGMFLSRLRILLNQKTMNKVRFLSVSMMAALVAQRQPGFRGTDYILTSRLDRVRDRDPAKGTSVVTSFQLTDARNHAIIWEGSYQVGAEDLAESAYAS